MKKFLYFVISIYNYKCVCLTFFILSLSLSMERERDSERERCTYYYHQDALAAQSFLTPSRHPFLSSISPARSSKLHLVCSQS